MNGIISPHLLVASQHFTAVVAAQLERNSNLWNGSDTTATTLVYIMSVSVALLVSLPLYAIGLRTILTLLLMGKAMPPLLKCLRPSSAGDVCTEKASTVPSMSPITSHCVQNAGDDPSSAKLGFVTRCKAFVSRVPDGTELMHRQFCKENVVHESIVHVESMEGATPKYTTIQKQR
jgi:hypothetical protein